jgi:hypothetical protein
MAKNQSRVSSRPRRRNNRTQSKANLLALTHGINVALRVADDRPQLAWKFVDDPVTGVSGWQYEKLT